MVHDAWQAQIILSPVFQNHLQLDASYITTEAQKTSCDVSRKEVIPFD